LFRVISQIMRASGRPPYSHRDPSRPGRGGDRLDLSIGGIANRLMSLRSNLSRRLGGPPQRPGASAAAQGAPPSWLTPPQAMLRREAPALSMTPWAEPVRDEPKSDAFMPDDGPAAPPSDVGLFEETYESRIDERASSPGVLIRTPRRPSSMAPVQGHAASPAPSHTLCPSLPPLAAPSGPAYPPVPAEAVRFTRTPDFILMERRQRALEAERDAQAQAEALVAAQEAAQAAALAAAEAARAEAEAETLRRETLAAQALVEAAEAVPLWRQPFVPPPGVRFFRTPDRRPAAQAAPVEVAPDAMSDLSRPAEPAAAPAPVPEAPDWSDLPDLSDLLGWFGGLPTFDAWSVMESPVAQAPPCPSPVAAMPVIEAETAPAPILLPAPEPVRAQALAAETLEIEVLAAEAAPVRPCAVPAMAARAAIRPARPRSVVAAPALVVAPIAVTARLAPIAPGYLSPFVLSALPVAAPVSAPAPSYAVVAIETPARAPAWQPAPEPVQVSVQAPEPIQELAYEPAIAQAEKAPSPVAAVPRPATIPPRPVLLRTTKGLPEREPEENVFEELSETVASESEFAEPVRAESVFAQPISAEPEAVAADAPIAPALSVPNMPRAILPERSHLIPAGRHIPMSFVGSEDYELPALELLAEPMLSDSEEVDADELEQNALNLQQTVQDFGVRGDILAVRPGPVVTLYELEPAPGTKSSRVIGLSDDIARSMSAVSARVAVVPGRNVIGIELPNAVRETVYLRELLASVDFVETKHKLALCLGKNIGGEPIIADLARMPHLLVAGTTGSGKSVAINTMILSLLYRLKPEECRLIMVDPKMLELSVYDGIPHLLSPVVIDPKKAVIALKWAVREMEERYKKMSKVNVRNIDGYNARLDEARARGEILTRTVQTGFDRQTGEAIYENEEMDLNPLPYIVIVVDEMADLMMVAGKDIEGAIQRLAQMARAAGIHLIMATQRPSVDVITGTIKANFPTRISFQVTSKIDSRTILGEMGAEQLLGQGDMLFMAGGGRTTRVHGPFCSDSEVETVVAHLKRQGRPSYLEAVTADDGDIPAGGAGATDDAPVFDGGQFGAEGGDLYDQAVTVVLRDKKASTSYIQRRLQIGYNRAASIMERMETEGLVGPANHAGKREILVETEGAMT